MFVWLLSVLARIVVAILLRNSMPTSPNFPCNTGMPSFIFEKDEMAQVVNLPEGNYLPLYDEPMRSGGTEGGMTNGTMFSIKAGPICNDYGIWWQVNGPNSSGYKRTGWIRGISFEDTKIKIYLLPR